MTFTTALEQRELEEFAASDRGKAATEVTIQAECSDENSPKIDFGVVSFANLESLNLRCQAVKALNFQGNNYPKLKHLRMDSLLDEVQSVNFDLPLLETISFQFVNVNDPRGFGKSLSRSPRLKTFSSYKLYGLLMGSKFHTLALPRCEVLDFHRAEGLLRLKLWAPKLKTLNLQSCHELEKVVILDRKPQGYTGEDYEVDGEPTPYTVNIDNVCERPAGNVLTHTRCVRVLGKPFD